MWNFLYLFIIRILFIRFRFNKYIDSITAQVYVRMVFYELFKVYAGVSSEII